MEALICHVDFLYSKTDLSQIIEYYVSKDKHLLCTSLKKLFMTFEVIMIYSYTINSGSLCRIL